MKTLVLSALLSLNSFCFTSPTFAQDPEPKPPSKHTITLAAGVLLGRINLDLSAFNIPDNDTDPGYRLQLSYAYHIREHLRVQTEFTYWQQAAKLGTDQQEVDNFPLPIVPDGALVTLDTDLRLGYLENTWLLQGDLTHGKLRVFLEGGAFIGRLMFARNDGFLRVNFNEQEIEVPYDNQDQRDEFKEWNYGLAVGGGITYPLLGGELMLLGRGNFGLANIANEENTTYSEVKTYNAGISLGYGFTF